MAYARVTKKNNNNQNSVKAENGMDLLFTYLHFTAHTHNKIHVDISVYLIVR